MAFLMSLDRAVIFVAALIVIIVGGQMLGWWNV